MIQYYLDLEKQVKAITEINLTNGQIQKIYSTAHFISLSIRTYGKTWHLYLGRGGGFEGVWLSDKAPGSLIRRKDRFLEYIRSHLSSCSLIKISLDASDRIVELQYQKFGNVQSLLLFWKSRKLYFAHYYQEIPEGPFKVLLSWRGKSSTIDYSIENKFELFDEIGRDLKMPHTREAVAIIGIDDLLIDEEKKVQQKLVNSPAIFLKRKIQNIEGDLSRAIQWKEIQSIIDKQESLDGIYELKVGDQKIKFEGNLNLYERRNLLFEKIKKLKRGEQILRERLFESQELLKDNESYKKMDHSRLPIIQPVWGKEVIKEESVTTSDKKDESYRLFRFDFYTIAVGLNSQGNDSIRIKWATKEDMWVHLDGLKSAHAVIKLTRGQTHTSEMIEMAASVVAFFSQFSDEWIPIIFTQVKNLKGVSGAPGMVTYKKEKHLKCFKVPDLQWLKG